MISKDEVEHVVQLANLNFSPKELTKFQKELSSILEFVSKLQEVKTDKIQHRFTLVEHSKAKLDVSRPSLPTSEALKNVSKTMNEFIKIEKLFEWI